MSLFVVDVEADGPCPGLGSMIEIGIIRVDKELKTGISLQLKPIEEKYNPEALKAIGLTREETLKYPEPKLQMEKIEVWLKENNIGKHMVMLSDNPAFDHQWTNYYFHHYIGSNPFGFSARRIGDLYCGLVKNFGANRDWKKLRRTPHSHKALDDARGNAEALIEFARRFDLYLPL